MLWEVTGRPANRTVAIRGERIHGLVHLREAQIADRAQLRAFDSMVQWFITHPDLRQKLAPAGSQRQQAVRRALAVVRARL